MPEVYGTCAIHVMELQTRKLNTAIFAAADVVVVKERLTQNVSEFRITWYIDWYTYTIFVGEKELVEFLAEEILAERKAQKVKTIPSELEGFKASLNGAEVILTKMTDNET